MDRIVEFLFEVGMLKRTPRSGWQFLGSGSESVAEHAFRTAWIRPVANACAFLVCFVFRFLLVVFFV